MNHRESNPPNLEEPQDTAEPQQTRPPSLIMPVLSWVLPLVICGATIFLVVNCWDMSENWPKWILLVVLLSISSTLTYLSPNQRKNDKYRHVKVHATVGLVFNILTFCFVFLGMAAASLLMYANSPEGIAAIKKHRQQQRAKTWHERQVAREEEQRLKQQKAKRIADQRQAQSLRDFNKKREQQIIARDIEAAYQFQFGNHGRRMPVIDSRLLHHTQHIPEPLITPQPLKREQYEVIVTSVEQDLAVGAWTFEGDVKIQPIKIKTRTSDLASKLRVRHVLWANDGSPLFYVCAGNSLLELDSENWRMVREVNLGSTITSVTRCQDGIAVSTTHRITILDSESLKVKTAIPVCGVNEVAGSPANNRLFVSFQQRNGAMAVLNLDTDTIEHIVTPEQLKGLGVDAKPKGHRPSSKFSDLRVTNDGKFLLAHTATAALRCAINNEKLCFLDSNRRGSVSQNGRYFANNAGVFDITKSLSSPIAKSRATFDWPDMLPTPGCKLQKLGGQWVAVTRLSKEDARQTELKVSSPTWSSVPDYQLRVSSHTERDGFRVLKLTHVSSCCFSEDGRYAYCCANHVSRVDLKTGQVVANVKIPYSDECKVSLSSEGLVVVGTTGKTIAVLDPESLKVIRCIDAPVLSDYSANNRQATSPNSPLLVAAMAGGRVGGIDLRNGKIVWEHDVNSLAKTSLPGHTARDNHIKKITFSEDGVHVMALLNLTWHHWKLTPDGLVGVDAVPQKLTRSQAVFSPDGSKLVYSASYSGIQSFSSSDFSHTHQTYPEGLASMHVAMNADASRIWRLSKSGLHEYSPENQHATVVPVKADAGSSLSYARQTNFLLAQGKTPFAYSTSAYLIDLNPVSNAKQETTSKVTTSEAAAQETAPQPAKKRKRKKRKKRN